MSAELMIRHCSPTLAGIKTANMFVCPYSDDAALTKSLKAWNRLLKKKGLRVLCLRKRKKRALIYVYRPARLTGDLGHELANRLLTEYGYDTCTCGRCIAHLVKRMCEHEDFPHEVGLFLGYPPEDVHGFINDKAGEHKLVGCWKVYSDAEAAKKVFDEYKKCTGEYCAMFENGASIEQLAVSC